MTTQNSKVFNDYQRQALTALGLRVWQSAPRPPAEQGLRYCYRLEQWLVVVNERLERQRHQWQHDFIAVLCEREQLPVAQLAEVSANTLTQWSPERVFDLRHDADSSEAVLALKRRLWQQLCQSSKR